VAQNTGVSHPDQTVIASTPEVPRSQPEVYLPYNPKPALTEHAQAVPNPDGSMAIVAKAEPGTPVTAPDPDQEIVTRLEGPANQLPVGTILLSRLTGPLSSKTTPQGSVFTANLDKDVIRDGRVLLPAGSMITGKVTSTHSGRRVSGTAWIHLEATSVTLPDGTRYQLRGQVIDTGRTNTTRVDQEGTILHKTNSTDALALMMLTTGSSAAAGAVFGGAPGALIGAGVGAGVSTVMWLKGDRQAELPAGTKVAFTLTVPVTVGVE
jgi:hypothetical protein